MGDALAFTLFYAAVGVLFGRSCLAYWRVEPFYSDVPERGLVLGAIVAGVFWFPALIILAFAWALRLF